MKQRVAWAIWLPILCFVLYIPFSSAIDLRIASFFAGKTQKFHPPRWTWAIYRQGLWPGQLLFVGSTLILLVCAFRHSRSPTARASLFLCLTLIVGSGVCGHALLKQFWARPRPKQTSMFGGKYPFLPLWKPYVGDKDRYLRSLPSGHATMGFYFFALYLVGRRMKKRWLAAVGLFLAIFLGGLLSFARMAQGGHFFSDIVVSCLIMWLSANLLDRLLLEPKGKYVPDA